MEGHSSFLNSIFLFAIILVAAKAASELCERFKQPSVLGEILVGALIGAVPWVQEAAKAEEIGFIAELGVMLLLFEVGLDSEISMLLRVGMRASLVAVIGVVLPILFGTVLMMQLGYPFPQSLFVGGVFTATSVGITARVFRDLKVLREKAAQVVIGAAVIDDVLGLLVLSVLLGYEKPGENPGNPVLKLAVAVVFLVGSVVLGRLLAPRLMGVVRKMRSRGNISAVAFVFCLSLAGLGALPAIGLATIVGAFGAGLILSSTEEKVPMLDRIKPAADVFVPVFFVMVGMKIQLSLFSDWHMVALAAALFAAAVPSKVLAGFAARTKGIDPVLVGVGMLPRGEVGLIFASIGLASGILTVNIYSASVIALLLTTVVTPPWLMYRLAKVKRA